LQFFILSGDEILASTKTQLSRGKYIFQLAGCNSCHTDRTKKHEPLAGGVAIETPFGIFFGPNITSDKTNGIGNWSDKDFVKAMREGIAPDGSHYFPAFPFTSYTKMTNEDLMDLKAYIFSFPKQSRESKTHQILFPFKIRSLQFFWKKLFFKEGVYRQLKRNGTQWNRGSYLVNAVTHCGECHTPRNFLGGRKTDRFLSGVNGSAGVQQTPNITPDLHTGIGKWSNNDLKDVLKFGLLPDGDTVGGSMVEVSENLSNLSSNDLSAVIFFLNSIPKISNRIGNKR
jgi:mono/diheme cytochrome c family protein